MYTVYLVSCIRPLQQYVTIFKNPTPFFFLYEFQIRMEWASHILNSLCSNFYKMTNCKALLTWKCVYIVMARLDLNKSMLIRTKAWNTCCQYIYFGWMRKSTNKHWAATPFASQIQSGRYKKLPQIGAKSPTQDKGDNCLTWNT